MSASANDPYSRLDNAFDGLQNAVTTYIVAVNVRISEDEAAAAKAQEDYQKAIASADLTAKGRDDLEVRMKDLGTQHTSQGDNLRETIKKLTERSAKVDELEASSTSKASELEECKKKVTSLETKVGLGLSKITAVTRQMVALADSVGAASSQLTSSRKRARITDPDEQGSHEPDQEVAAVIIRKEILPYYHKLGEQGEYTAFATKSTNLATYLAEKGYNATNWMDGLKNITGSSLLPKTVALASSISLAGPIPAAAAASGPIDDDDDQLGGRRRTRRRRKTSKQRNTRKTKKRTRGCRRCKTRKCTCGKKRKAKRGRKSTKRRGKGKGKK